MFQIRRLLVVGRVFGYWRYHRRCMLYATSRSHWGLLVSLLG
jgi:hypothetical protein